MGSCFVFIAIFPHCHFDDRRNPEPGTCYPLQSFATLHSAKGFPLLSGLGLSVASRLLSVQGLVVLRDITDN